MKDRKLLGMKSHDCHVLMKHMLPIAIRGILQPQIRHTITKLCLFFNNIHSKVIDTEELENGRKTFMLHFLNWRCTFHPHFLM